jgi:ABC-type phosphate transport system substrate-binding protein
MSSYSVSKGLRDGASLLALSTVVLMAVEPAHATDGVYGGGSTLASLLMRQEGDCFLGANVTGDGYSFSAAFNAALPTPAKLPVGCTAAPHPILELYAGVGSGAGLRGYISNDPKQFFRGSVKTTTAPQTVQLPADPPKFIDSAAGAPFNSYPYPSVDFGASDSPLPSNLVTTSGTFGTFVYNVAPVTNWQSATKITVTRADTTSTVAYNVASFGKPIQLPMMEAPVAVAVNLPAVGPLGSTTAPDGVKWTIRSQFSATAPGGRIQLSTAQVCAIFSGLVKDWNSTANIPYLKNNGTTGVESFAAANTWHAGSSFRGTGGGVPYASVSKPIVIVYRSDGSGTSFIFTNYLKTVCPLLDPTDTYKYKSIFETTALPNNSFTQLINKITAVGRSVNAIGASGSDAVAAAIGKFPAFYGRIGYLSNDFVAPYNPNLVTRPHAASLMNDYLRVQGVYHPGQSVAGVPKNFIAPTPASADAAWSSLLFAGVNPSTSWGYNDYNVYAKTFKATTYLPGTGTKVDVTGRSILPLAIISGAYPVVGTAYAYLYSCYGTGRGGVPAATRVKDLKSYLNWHYSDSKAKDIMANNGFHALPTNWVNALTAEYLYDVSASAITAYNPLLKVRGCTAVTGGAH